MTPRGSGSPAVNGHGVPAEVAAPPIGTWRCRDDGLYREIQALRAQVRPFEAHPPRAPAGGERPPA
ncbi:hypothetical protein [Nonomuraea sp. NPDC050783]|uniref:hypothetical protein n=1 Tax=Nonomuraea sp. NPDC050783 TaxID=3154634 RepID=UPI0034663B96